MDTMVSFKDNKLSTKFLSDDELMVKCPYAFKDEPTNPNVSNKYEMATTMDVVHDMAKLGWYPVEAKQCRTKKNSSGIRSFHMIAFQNPDVVILKDGEVEAYPRIICQNSHDGFNSFKFMCGLYRLVCSNGLILADVEYANISIRHINYTFTELRTVINDIVVNLDDKINIINDMRKFNLSDDEKIEFATNVIKLRKNVSINEHLDISYDTIEDILTPIRDEDEGNSLWNVYNVLQEKIIKGMFNYSKDEHTKPRKMRKIVSPIKDIKINSDIFNLANNYLKIAA